MVFNGPLAYDISMGLTIVVYHLLGEALTLWSFDEVLVSMCLSSNLKQIHRHTIHDGMGRCWEFWDYVKSFAQGVVRRNIFLTYLFLLELRQDSNRKGARKGDDEI